MAKPAYIWDGSAWVSILGPSVTSIDDLSDVVITSPSTNQILQYNGTNWVNATNSGGSSSNSFETIAVSGQSNVVADSSTDTLTLVAGSNITITTNATSDSITIAATDTNTTYSAATSTTLGLIELFSDTTQSTAANAVTSTASRTYGLQINSSGQGVINVPWTDTTYSAATSTALGLIELFSDTVQATSANAVTSTASRTYGIQVNGDGQAVVNVPWTDTDTNTTYSISAETTTGGANLRLTDSSAGTDDVKIEAGTNMSVTRTDSNTIKLDSTGNYTSVDSITYPDYITFDTTPETVPTAAGSIYWDSGESAPGVILNANVELRLGQEEVVLVKNATGSSIAKGKVVYINGAQGQRPTIALSDADTEATSSKTLGLTAETIADGAEGFVTTFGVLRGVNTDGLTEGAMLWLSSTAGGYTTSVPAEPAHAVFLGYVVKANASSGEIFVNVQNGYELTELHGVTIDGTPADNEILAYDSTSTLWINQTADEANIIDKTTAQTMSNKTLTLPKINDTSSDHTYDFAVSELAANRTITLPLLTTNDTFVFAAHSQTLTNKTINGADNTLTVRIANDVSGLGTNVATFLATPSSANLASAVTDETGSGSLVFATSPSLTTPTLGVASATSINKLSITAPATGSTLTVADGKTLTASNTLTFTGTDGSTLNIGTGGTLGTMAYETASNYLTTSTASSTYAALAGATFTGAVALNGGFSVDSTAFSVADTTGNTSIAGTLSVTGAITGSPATPGNTTSADGVGYVGMPQVSTSTGLSLTATHAGKHIYTTSTGQTHTIPANSSVPLEIGTTIVFINPASVTTTIDITTDTLYLAGTGTTGSRTLAPYGMATAVKITSTSWIISGNGLT